MNKRIIFLMIVILTMAFLSSCGLTKDEKKSDSEACFPDATIDCVDISIPGISGEYNILYITDSHMNFDEREDLGWFGTKDARIFRNEFGELSSNNFSNWINYVNDSNVDAMIMGGDMLDFYSKENINTLKKHLEELEKPYLYSYGNHDSYVPWENKFNDTDEEFTNLFNDGEIECQMLDMGEWLVVSVRNYQNDGTAQVSEKALEQYRKYERIGKPILLVCHVPVCTEQSTELLELVNQDIGQTIIQYDAGKFGTVNKAVLLGKDMGYELEPSTKEFLSEITDEDSPVIAILSGHLHTKWEGKITDSTYEYVGAAGFQDKAALIRISGE